MDAPHGLKTNRDDSVDLNTKAIKRARTEELSSNIEMDLEHDMSMNHIIYLGLKNLSWGATIPRVIDPENTPSGQLNNFQKVVEILVEEFNYHGDSIEMRKLINNTLKFSRGSCNEIAGKCHAICKKSFEHLNFTFICFKENNFLSFNQNEMQLLIDNSAYFNKLKAFYPDINIFKNNTTDLLEIDVSDFEQVISGALDLSQQNICFPKVINFKAFNVVSYPQMSINDIEIWAEEHNKENDVEPPLPSILRLGAVSNYLGFEKYNENSCSIIGNYVPSLSVSAKLSLHAYLMGIDSIVYVNEELRSMFVQSFGEDLIISTKPKKKDREPISTADLIDSFVGCKISNISMKTMIIPKLINKFSTLTKLQIVRPNVNKRHNIYQIDFKQLVGLNLNSLSLQLNYYDDVENGNIYALKDMKIEYLDISYIRTDINVFYCNKYLSTMCGFPLKTLKLVGISGFTDEVLGKIGEISTLAILKISSTQVPNNNFGSITNVGLKALAKPLLEHLELIYLNKTDGKDSSFFKSFKHLKSFKLNFLDDNFSINDESINNFLHLPLTHLTINTCDQVSKGMLLLVSKISTLKNLKVHFLIDRKKKILPTLPKTTQFPSPNARGMAAPGMGAMPAPMAPQLIINMMPGPMMRAPMMGAPMMGAPMMGAPMMGAPMMPAPMMGAPMMPAPMMDAQMMGAQIMGDPMNLPRDLFWSKMLNSKYAGTDYDYDKIITFKSPIEVSSFVTKCMKEVTSTKDVILEADLLNYLEVPKAKNVNDQFMDIETEVMPFLENN